MHDRIRRLLVAGLASAGLAFAPGCARHDGETTAAGTADTTGPPRAPAAGDAATVAAACERLRELTLDGVAIEAAAKIAGRDVPASAARNARLDVPHCRVTGVIDAAIRFELLMPDDWNGRFLMGGGGGFVGSVENQPQDGLPPGMTPLDRGYATAGTDTGHQASGTDASWALYDPEAQQNFAHRGVHRTTEVSKAIIADYYAGEIDRSYFFGCSRGGGQALIEAQRYPQDFDGIVAGAPAMDWPGTAAGMVQNQQRIFPDPRDLSSPVITAENRALLARSIRNQCDAIDGVADGLLNDPRDCGFDPADLPRCGSGPGPECLTDEQLGAIQTVYRGPVVGGEPVYPGFPFGGETVGWPTWITKPEQLVAAIIQGAPNLHFAFGTELMKNFIFSDPDWTYEGYTFEDWAEVSAPVAALLNSTDPDLSAFDARGGKLILYHGWSDAALTAFESIDYYESAAALDPDIGDHFRMFLLPGVAHCVGGPGPDQVDWIATLERWVEGGVAPDRVIASKVDAAGNTTMRRPLCPYPAEAVYDGSGDPNAAESFACETASD